MQFISEHCACKGMYDPNTGLRKQGVKYKAMCKKVKVILLNGKTTQRNNV